MAKDKKVKTVKKTKVLKNYYLIEKMPTPLEFLMYIVMLGTGIGISIIIVGLFAFLVEELVTSFVL